MAKIDQTVSEEVKQKIISSLEKYKKDSLVILGGKKSFQELVTSEMGRLTLRDAGERVLYAMCFTTFKTNNIQMVNRTVAQLVSGAVRINYNIETEKIEKSFKTEENFVQRCKLLQDHYDRVEEAVRLIQTEFSDVIFSIENTTIWWKAKYLNIPRVGAVSILKNNYIFRIKGRCQEIKEANEKIVNANRAVVIKMKYFGNIVAVEIAKLVDKNNKEINANDIVALLQNHLPQLKRRYKPTENCGLFELIPERTIRDIIETLIKDKVLAEYSFTARGHERKALRIWDNWLSFVVLSTNDVPFAGMEFAGNTEYSVLETLRKNPDIYCEMDKHLLAENLIWLSEHPAIYCLEKETVKSIAKRVPKEEKEILKTSQEFEKYKKILAGM